MLFYANSDNDEIIEGSDNSDSGEAIETMDYDEYIEAIDYGESGEGSDIDDSGSGFNFGRFLLIAFIVLFTVILVGYGIFSWYEAEQYRKWDALERHSRTYAEFAEAFNELMEPQGIFLDAEPVWRPIALLNEDRLAISGMTLPDGSWAPCGIKLWGSSVKSSHIMRLGVLLSKKQAAYMEPVVRGVYSVFAPEVNEHDYEGYAKIFRILPQAFAQNPYEWEWYVCPDTDFSMMADDSDYVTLLWQISHSRAGRRY